jgi:hypothetical protein
MSAERFALRLTVFGFQFSVFGSGRVLLPVSPFRDLQFPRVPGGDLSAVASSFVRPRLDYEGHVGEG